MSESAPAFVAALTDPQIVTVTLYGEARGSSIESQIAVGCAIRNRVHTGRWGASYAQVCLAPWQFSCWRPEGGRVNHQIVMAAAEALAKSTHLPDDLLLRQCAWIAQGIIGQWILDTVHEATHYYNPKAMQPVGAIPNWALNHSPVAEVGGHLFFAKVS